MTNRRSFVLAATAAATLFFAGAQGKALATPGASANGYVVGPSTKLQVYAIMSKSSGVFRGFVLFKGWVDFKGVSIRIIVGNATFAPIKDDAGNVIGNSCTTSGAVLWKGVPSTLKFTWYDYNGVTAGDAWYEVRANSTGALQFGSGVDWVTDAGVKVGLGAVRVVPPL